MALQKQTEGIVAEPSKPVRGSSTGRNSIISLLAAILNKHNGFPVVNWYR
jgi:hypothetical protein